MAVRSILDRYDARLRREQMRPGSFEETAARKAHQKALEGSFGEGARQDARREEAAAFLHDIMARTGSSPETNVGEEYGKKMREEGYAVQADVGYPRMVLNQKALSRKVLGTETTAAVIREAKRRGFTEEEIRRGISLAGVELEDTDDNDKVSDKVAEKKRSELFDTPVSDRKRYDAYSDLKKRSRDFGRFEDAIRQEANDLLDKYIDNPISADLDDWLSRARDIGLGGSKRHNMSKEDIRKLFIEAAERRMKKLNK